jgi:hypothetical protein
MARARDIANIINSGTFATQESLNLGLASKNTSFSDIHSTNSSSDPTSVQIVKATRTHNGITYNFNGLTFNMPSNSNTDTSDWTSPGSSYKWSYVYIRPSDNKFFISDSAPNRGENFRNISGNTLIYLFPIYSRDTSLFRFELFANHYEIQQINALIGNNIRVPGITINNGQTPTNTSHTVDFSSVSKIPNTASTFEASYRIFYVKRDDSGNTGIVRGSLSMQNISGNYVDLTLIQDYTYYKTPDVSGQYFLDARHESTKIQISTTFYNPAFTRAFSNYRLGVAGGTQGWAFNIHSFTDRSVF